jgi:hypothetical protein
LTHGGFGFDAGVELIYRSRRSAFSGALIVVLVLDAVQGLHLQRHVADQASSGLLHKVALSQAEDDAGPQSAGEQCFEQRRVKRISHRTGDEPYATS